MDPAAKLQFERSVRDRLGLRVGSTYAAGAEVLMATLTDQTSMTWPEDFPRKKKRETKDN
jgi:hypothetical protein